MHVSFTPCTFRKLQQNDRPTNRAINQPTAGHSRGHREVILPTNYIYTFEKRIFLLAVSYLDKFFAWQKHILQDIHQFSLNYSILKMRRKI